MSNIRNNLSLILILILAQNTREYRFIRRIQEIGYPYYKIIMVLGECRETVLFFDQKIWGKISLNRVLDIYFKCDNERYKVSSVEIKLVINNTSSFAYSEEGVGQSEFSGTLYLPTNLNFVIYALTIFTCNKDPDSNELSFSSRSSKPLEFMPFIHSRRIKKAKL